MTRKIYILIAFLLTLMLFGCQQTKPVQTQANQLPTMKVRIGEETFSTARGGYCWTTGNQSECTDASGNPFDYGTSAPPIDAEPVSEFELLFSEAPSSFSVEWVNDLEHETVTEQTSFSTPSKSGTYGYSVHANWDQGDVTFHFILLIK
ncbi:intracellular growth attenuator family protein [Sporosarcina cyprini]|uniref:intracellular growth attenuator family protein n=1 Tax=Sporosarcina cyprini TaxID=2910523 RepID=UPI001EE0C730|nr:intracellular growth attenuator family protein [Sporosarcina cyprini]MCG3087510.1 intracellular growth attenuator family protein [Sporosarcina cyprini]